MANHTPSPFIKFVEPCGICLLGFPAGAVADRVKHTLSTTWPEFPQITKIFFVTDTSVRDNCVIYLKFDHEKDCIVALYKLRKSRIHRNSLQANLAVGKYCKRFLATLKDPTQQLNCSNFCSFAHQKITDPYLLVAYKEDWSNKLSSVEFILKQKFLTRQEVDILASEPSRSLDAAYNSWGRSELVFLNLNSQKLTGSELMQAIDKTYFEWALRQENPKEFLAKPANQRTDQNLITTYDNYTANFQQAYNNMHFAQPNDFLTRGVPPIEAHVLGQANNRGTNWNLVTQNAMSGGKFAGYVKSASPNLMNSGHVHRHRDLEAQQDPSGIGYVMNPNVQSEEINPSYSSQSEAEYINKSRRKTRDPYQTPELSRRNRLHGQPGIPCNNNAIPEGAGVLVYENRLKYQDDFNLQNLNLQDNYRCEEPGFRPNQDETDIVESFRSQQRNKMNHTTVGAFQWYHNVARSNVDRTDFNGHPNEQDLWTIYQKSDKSNSNLNQITECNDLDAQKKMPASAIAGFSSRDHHDLAALWNNALETGTKNSNAGNDVNLRIPDLSSDLVFTSNDDRKRFPKPPNHASQPLFERRSWFSGNSGARNHRNFGDNAGGYLGRSLFHNDFGGHETSADRQANERYHRFYDHFGGNRGNAHRGVRGSRRYDNGNRSYRRKDARFSRSNNQPQFHNNPLGFDYFAALSSFAAAKVQDTIDLFDASQSYAQHVLKLDELIQANEREIVSSDFDELYLKHQAEQIRENYAIRNRAVEQRLDMSWGHSRHLPRSTSDSALIKEGNPKLSRTPALTTLDGSMSDDGASVHENEKVEDGSAKG